MGSVENPEQLWVGWWVPLLGRPLQACSTLTYALITTAWRRLKLKHIELEKLLSQKLIQG